jgi:uncharacterized membrane protein
MTILLLGLVVFIGAHVFVTLREARAGAIARLGDGPYKVLFSVVSFIGLALIVVGFGHYRAGGYIPVWTPPTWTRHVTISLMWFAFVSIVAAYAPRGKIAGWLRHPMLVAVKIWALAHLLVKGDLGSMILFGSLLAYAVFDRIAVKRRGDMGAPRGAPFGKGDIIALVAGTIAYVAMIVLHPYLIGVPVMVR